MLSFFYYCQYGVASLNEVYLWMGITDPFLRTLFRIENRQNSVESSRGIFSASRKTFVHITMFTSSILSASSVTSAPRIFVQPLRVLTARRSPQAYLRIAAMASSAGTQVGKDTPDSKWKEILSTEGDITRVLSIGHPFQINLRVLACIVVVGRCHERHILPVHRTILSTIMHEELCSLEQSQAYVSLLLGILEVCSCWRRVQNTEGERHRASRKWSLQQAQGMAAL